jgi:DNA-binding Lrp family transcriptional regulator
MIEVAGRNTRKVAQTLRGLPQIHALYSTNGAYDLIAEIEVENLEEFDRVLSDVRMIDGVARSETSLLLARA